MQTTAITAVTQLINEGRVRYGDLATVEVPPELWEQAMDEVTEAGGAVGFDHCMVDGVRVEQVRDVDAPAAFVLSGSGRRETLSS
jgi:hypothetical protein